MKRAKLIERLDGCLPVLDRCGIKNYTDVVVKLSTLSAVEISKKVRWMKRVERACIEEATYYKDMTPSAWLNLTMISPGCEEVKKLRALRTAVKKAWRS